MGKICSKLKFCIENGKAFGGVSLNLYEQNTGNDLDQPLLLLGHLKEIHSYLVLYFNL